jgi:quercetin dioxygenase-like cupin family protein
LREEEAGEAREAEEAGRAEVALVLTNGVPRVECGVGVAQREHLRVARGLGEDGRRADFWMGRVGARHALVRQGEKTWYWIMDGEQHCAVARPGDVFVIPAGVWHATSGRGASS